MIGRALRLFSQGMRVRWMSTGAPGQQPPAFKLPIGHQIPNEAALEMRQTIDGSMSCKMIAALLKDNVKYVTDVSLGNMYAQLLKYDLPLDNSFYDVVAPITKEYIKVFNRENATSLGKIAITCGYLKVQDAELWKLLFKKLQDEGLHKYVTLNSTVFLLEALTVHGAFNNEPLVQTLHNTIVKHKSFYERFPHLLEVIDRISSQVRSSGVRQEQPQLGQKLKEISH